MKLPLLLTTLLLSATPSLAEDLVYLRCNATAHFKQIDLTEIKVVNEKIDEGVVVHYEIDLNKNLLADSDDPENPVLVKVQNGMIFSQNSAFTKGRMNVNFFSMPKLHLNRQGGLMQEVRQGQMTTVSKLQLTFQVFAKHRMLKATRQANEPPTTPHSPASLSITCACKASFGSVVRDKSCWMESVLLGIFSFCYSSFRV